MPIPTSWLLAPLLVLLAGGAGYLAGDHDRNNAWLAKQALVERQAHAAYEAEVRRGRAAATEYITARSAMQTQFETLEGKFDELRQRGPLVVFRRAVAADHAAGAGTAEAANTTATTADPAHVGAAGGADPALTLGAVWMWNSALTGTDVPAGACGAADTADAACAADAGIDLATAWRNQEVNAKSCALDRLRYQRLIDFLTTGPTP